jgi:hypothetical protein
MSPVYKSNLNVGEPGIELCRHWFCAKVHEMRPEKCTEITQFPPQKWDPPCGMKSKGSAINAGFDLHQRE